MVLADKKKKKVSKRNKSAWRKHTDIQDVENFLEEKRSDQRLGVDKLANKKDSELFVVDVECPKPTQGKARSRAEKKIWAREPSSYQLALIPTSAVEDPIKRNRVRTKEERMHPARKAKDEALKAKGLMRKKAMEAQNNRIQTIKKNRDKRIKDKIIKFDHDPWNNDTSSQVDDSWLGYDAKRQALMDCKEFKVRPPSNLSQPRSRLPKVEAPHPGLSYNPSLADHKDLISQVVDKEVELMKKDAHIARVTAPFKVKAEKSDEWVENILSSLGIPRKDEENEIKDEPSENEEEDTKEGIVKKPLPKMKTKRQRRIQKRLKDEALQRKLAAVEKRKTSDIYQLRKIMGKVEKGLQRQEEESAAKKDAKTEYQKSGTKRLAKTRFEEPLQDFTSSMELAGSLRRMKPKPTLLRDRFFSLQKRNILQPTKKSLKMRKRKVKVVIKRDHRFEEDISQKLKSTGKLKIINSG